MISIGERLQEARKKRGASIREAAESTKIRADYLQKFEESNFDIGLSAIYIRGFLRTYAEYLKLDSARLISDYKALTGDKAATRAPNREIYGKMDISVSTSGSAPEGQRAEESPPVEVGTDRKHRSYQEPSWIDPVLIFKYFKWGAVVAVAILIFAIIKALLPTSRPNAPGAVNSTANSISQPSASVLTLVAVDDVYVSVMKRNPDESDGDILFKGMLQRGERKVIPKEGPIYISASAAQNLLLDYKGRTLKLEYNGEVFTGYKKVALQ